MENWNAHGIDSFVVINRSFYHSLRQRGNRIRIWMIDISWIYRLLDPSIQFDFCVSAMCLFLTVLIVFHVHILLYFPQILLCLGNHRFQLWWSEPWSILDIRKFQNIALTAIRKLIASLQRVVNAITNGLVGFSVVLLWIVLPDRISWADHVSLHVWHSIVAGQMLLALIRSCLMNVDVCVIIVYHEDLAGAWVLVEKHVVLLWHILWSLSSVQRVYLLR